MKQIKKKAVIALTAAFGVKTIASPLSGVIFAQEDEQVVQQEISTNIEETRNSSDEINQSEINQNCILGEAKIILSKKDWEYGKTPSNPISIVSQDYDTKGIKVDFYNTATHEAISTYSDENGNVTPPMNAGDYEMTVTLPKNEFYNEKILKEEFKISKASNDGGINLKDWACNEEPSTPTVTALYNPGNLEFEYTAVGSDNYSKEVPREQGNYIVRVIIPEGVNYYKITMSKYFTITKPKGKASVKIAGWTFGETENKPSIHSETNGTEGVKIYYKREGEGYSYTPYVPKNAGTYFVKAIFPGNDEYMGTSVISKFTIAKAQGKGSVSIGDWTYQTKAKTPKVSFYTGSDAEVNYFYKVKGADDNTYTKDVPQNAGEYTVKAEVGEAMNYLGFTTTADFTIAKATPSYNVPGITMVGINPDVTLGLVNLPEGFAWMDESLKVGGVGEKVFKAKFIPADTENYKVVEDIDIRMRILAYESENETTDQNQKEEENKKEDFVETIVDGNKENEKETIDQNQKVEENKKEDSVETAVDGSKENQKVIVKTEKSVQTMDTTKTCLWTTLCVASICVGALLMKKRKTQK